MLPNILQGPGQSADPPTKNYLVVNVNRAEVGKVGQSKVRLTFLGNPLTPEIDRHVYSPMPSKGQSSY